MTRTALALLLVPAVSACGGPSKRADAAPIGTTVDAPAGPVSAAPSSVPAAAPTPVKGKLTVAEARRYMVTLINRDRKTQGLAPVELDEAAPTLAGQAHTEDMARLGYLGHWGSDGSVPEQRHTEAGGADMVLENASCFTDEKKRALDPSPMIDAVQVERTESQFFDELPPNDGHRKNILRPLHSKVGIGVAQIVTTETESAVPCFSQEFTDSYATYKPLPQKVRGGALIHVEATANADVRPTGIGIARIDTPKPISAAELNKRRHYTVPSPYRTYWGPGFVTPLPVKIEGQTMALDLPLGDKGQPGLYEVSIWARIGTSKEQTMIGLRTVRVE